MTELLILIAVLCCQGDSDVGRDFDAKRAPGLDSADVADGWLSLFDSESMFGWRREANIDWSVKDGNLVATSGEVGLLRTAVQFADFELKLEYKAAESTNSGVFIRSSPRPKNLAKDCFEINIAPSSNPFPTASIVGHEKAKPVIWRDGWNSMRIVADGPSVKVWVNDQMYLDFKAAGDSYLGKGYIGLQHNAGEIAFRNVRLKPINLTPLFDGDDLDSWNARQALDSNFYIDKEKHLRMLGGRGQLESKNRYGDFVFSTHVKTNAVGLNSGVFFRCIPGDLMNGYESQIQNEFVDGDATKPKDCGTGGIFRRQNARFINATDEAWFAKTIVANGATMCVWVNGCLVADWTDKRKPHKNPRKGRRIDAGTFCLQGHDPTTDVSFRQMHVKELPKRIERR